MKIFNIKIHPLFLLVGCVLIYLGEGVTFLVYVLTVLLHEKAHFFVGDKMGLKLKSTSLTPFGGQVQLEMYKLSDSSEILVVLAGPMVNIFVCILLLALWQIFDFTQKYTQTLFIANLTTATVNLVPAFPLDGGRILYIYLRKLLGESKSTTFMSYFGLFVSSLFIVVFLYFIEILPYTLLSMAVFILLSSFFELKSERFFRQVEKFKHNKKEIMPIKTFVVDSDTPLFKLLKKIDNNNFSQFFVIKNGIKIALLNQNQLINFAILGFADKKIIELI